MNFNSKIVVVDDDPDIRDAVKLILEEEGYNVVTKENGKQLSDLVAAEKPSLVLLDIMLSGHDGREICKMLKSSQKTREVPVVMISANTNAEHSVASVGADMFLPKPFEVDTLLEVVHKYTTTPQVV